MTAEVAPQAPERLDRTKITPSMMFEDIVGIEEFAISRVFHQSVTALAEDPTQFLRMLVFVDLRRGGQKDKDAFADAQAMRLGEVRTYFVDEAEADEDAEGKDKP